VELLLPRILSTRRAISPDKPSRWLSGRLILRRLLALSALSMLAASGCGREEKSNYKSVATVPTVQVLRPPQIDILRKVSQPSYIEAYERSSVYPKMTGYIEKWIVDIGDKVKKGDTLATLYVPELVEEYGTKKATVKLDQERVDLALKVVEVARADVKAAKAALDEATAILSQCGAEVNRWNSEVDRLKREVDRGVVDPQILLQSTNRLKSELATRDAAKASVTKARAELLSKEASFGEAEVDVGVARAVLLVAESEQRRLEALVWYLKLPAPFDGVVVARNANTFDFVLPGAGDPTAMSNAVHLSPSGQAAPIYVVDRTDIVRVFVDIPELDGNYVKIGTKASVLVQAYSPVPIKASVTRTAWALNMKSRTLRAEVDLVNRNSQLLPGMYAYGTVFIERLGVRALPLSALSYRGERTFCWIHKNGRAYEIEVETGVSNREWIEIVARREPDGPTSSTGGQMSQPVDGSEEVIVSDVTTLISGDPVLVVPAQPEEKVAQAGGGPSLAPSSTTRDRSPSPRRESAPPTTLGTVQKVGAKPR
jgi:HlyD family secretion protein